MSINSEKPQPLRKIAEIELDGRVYALGKNGSYCLVDESSKDAWGRPIGVEVFDIKNLSSALLDALGEAIEKIRSMEMERERRMGKGSD